MELGVLVDEELGESVLPLAEDDDTMAAKDGMFDLGVARWTAAPLTDLLPPLPASLLVASVLGISPFGMTGELEDEEESMWTILIVFRIIVLCWKRMKKRDGVEFPD